MSNVQDENKMGNKLSKLKGGDAAPAENGQALQKGSGVNNGSPTKSTGASNGKAVASAPGEPRYHIEDKLKIVAPHHESFKQLWETKWKMPVSATDDVMSKLTDRQATIGIYPFMLGTARDFEGIVEAMSKANMKEPYEWDQYASYFIPKAEELEKKGKDAEEKGDKKEASEYYQ
jgi:hypothetical protein